MIPIGPAPVMSTSSPSTRKLSAECTALPNGSKIAATSGSIGARVPPDVGRRHDDVLGEAAVTVDADADGVGAQLAAPRQAACGSVRRPGGPRR